MFKKLRTTSPSPVFCPIDLSRFLCSARYNKGFEDIFGAGSILEKSTDLSVLLFDVTTLYFEFVREGELQTFGYSKDGKFNETQMVLAVLTDTEGLPLAYEVFPGHMGEQRPCPVF